MGKLGKFTYPDVSLTEAVKDAKKIYDRFKDEAVDPSLISETIGYKGGSFLRRLSALRKYGLITSRGKVKITDLGKRITYPTNKDDELRAIEEAIKNVELFKILFEKFGVELPKEKFWVNLINITGAEAPEAQFKEDIIRKIYTESVSPLTATISHKEKTPKKTTTAIEYDFINFETDDFKIQIRKDIDAIRFVKNHLMEIITPWLNHVEQKLSKTEGGSYD